MDKNGQIFDARHSFNGWQWEEWQEFQEKLWQLSLEELRELVDILEIKFTMGNEKISDKEVLSMFQMKRSKKIYCVNTKGL